MASLLTIKFSNGVLYFPTLQAVQTYAQHCGLTDVKFGHSLKGWFIRGAGNG